MTVSKCIRAKAAAGKVDKKKADEAAGLFDEFGAELRHRNSPRPDEQAADMATRILQHQAKTRKRAALQQMKAQLSAAARIDGSKGNEIEAALSFFSFDPTRKVAGFNVEVYSDFVRGQTHAIMVDFMQQFRTRAAGLDILSPSAKAKRKVALRDLVRELHGEKSGSESAKNTAKGVSEGFEYQRKLFNSNGGNIPKRADWGLPQLHSRRAVNASNDDEWADFVVDRLNREQMIDIETGQPFTDSKLRRILKGVYRNIVTNGLSDVEPGGFIGRGIATKRAHSRFLVFRNADAWLEYAERFGEGNAYDVVLSHVNSLSRDIAMMKVLGPNPDATVRFIENKVRSARGQQALEKTGKKGARAVGRIVKGQPAIRDAYAAASGALHQPGNEFWANVGGANRNVLTSAMLGGAFFSAIADRTFIRITAGLNGIPASRTIASHLKLMLPTSVADQRLAVQSGFISDAWNGVAIAEQRYLGEVIGPEWSQRMADTVLRLSLLSPWTAAGRNAFGLEFLGMITRSRKQSFKNLDPAFKSSMESYGISEGDWDIIRNTKPWRDDKTGAEFIRAQDIAGAIEDAGPLFERNFDIAGKMQNMILTETEFAVPSTNARVKALVTAGKQPGTFAGEVFRNTFLFKSFPITLVMTHLRRAALGNITRAQKAKYIAHLLIGTAIMGTLGEQMGQIAKGRDPLPMDPASEEGRRTWQKGLTRGGGLGIFGDFLFSDQNQYGGGLTNTFLGPVFGSEIPQAWNVTVGNLQDIVIEGEAKNAGRELTRFAKLMTPGRSLWYANLALERLAFDEMQKMIDPDYAESFRATERRARSEFNQQFFSPPGSGFPPRRAPRIERALE